MEPTVVEPTMIYVEWVDAHAGEPGWLTLEDYDGDGEQIVQTVGFLIRENEPGGKPEHLTVWQTLADGDGISPFHIPLVMVRKVLILKTGLTLTHRGDTVTV